MANLTSQPGETDLLRWIQYRNLPHSSAPGQNPPHSSKALRASAPLCTTVAAW